MIVTAAALTALQTGFKKHFQDAFIATRPQADFTKVATIIQSASASETYGWLGQFPKMREWAGDRVIKNMEAHGYSIKNKDFEGTVGVKRNDIEDDNLGVYAPLFQEMGKSAAEQPDDLVFSLLAKGTSETCYDGKAFFAADHPSFNAEGKAAAASNLDSSGKKDDPFWYLLDVTRPLKPFIYQERKKPEFVVKNRQDDSDHVFMKNQYLYGVDSRCNVGYGFWQMAYASNAALTGAALDKAFETMRSLRDSNGRPLGIKPSLLVVGPKLRAAANKTVKVMLGENGASNANYNAVEVLDTPWAA